MMAAQGLVPMVPAIQVTAFTFLLEDAEADIRKTARESLLAMPNSMVLNILKEPLHPKTLDFFARERTSDDKVTEAVLLNPNTSDDSFVFLADKVNEKQTMILANNQVRLLRTPTIAEVLKKNPNVLRSTLDTMISFLRMSGVVLQGESAELTQEEIQSILKAPEPLLPTGPDVPDLVKEFEENQELSEEKRKSIHQLVAAMKVSEKVKLALRGNKEARMLLIKDSNKVVCAAVVKSPRITDGEILSISNMRTIHDEVIRIISQNGDWTKHYSVQVALANNPKTPFPVALKFVKGLRVNDLKTLTKNKNVPSQLVKIAKELFVLKRT